jgi:hypothetical protein
VTVERVSGVCLVGVGCDGLKLCGGTVVGFVAGLAAVVPSAAATVASRPGRTNGSVPTLALSGFAAVVTSGRGVILARSRSARIWAC